MTGLFARSRSRSAPAFPAASFRDAARSLRRPFTAEAVKFKVQESWPAEDPAEAQIVSYIDARLVVERLNLVVPHLWHDEYRTAGDGLMWCDLTVDGITRPDVGEGYRKGLVSDALKRAAVKFGIGVSLYAIPKMVLRVGDGELERTQTRDGSHLAITPAGQERLRALYAEWLERHGRQAFGDPLDHGDLAGAQGDPEADTAREPDPAAVPAPAPPPAVVVTEPVIDADRAASIAQGMGQRGMTVRQMAGLLTGAGVKQLAMTTDGIETAIRGLTPDQAADVERGLKNVLPIHRTEA